MQLSLRHIWKQPLYFINGKKKTKKPIVRTYLNAISNLSQPKVLATLLYLCGFQESQARNPIFATISTQLSSNIYMCGIIVNLDSPFYLLICICI